MPGCRTADDRPSRRAPRGTLTNRSVARSENTENDTRRDYDNFPFHDGNPVCRIKLHTATDVAVVIQVSRLSGRNGARDTQIRALPVCPRPGRHAKSSSSHTVDMADKGLIQLPKDKTGYGSRADSGRRVAGISYRRLLW